MNDVMEYVYGDDGFSKYPFDPTPSEQYQKEIEHYKSRYIGPTVKKTPKKRVVKKKEETGETHKEKDVVQKEKENLEQGIKDPLFELIESELAQLPKETPRENIPKKKKKKYFFLPDYSVLDSFVTFHSPRM